MKEFLVKCVIRGDDGWERHAMVIHTNTKKYAENIFKRTLCDLLCVCEDELHCIKVS